MLGARHIVITQSVKQYKSSPRASAGSGSRQTRVVLQVRTRGVGASTKNRNTFIDAIVVPYRFKLPSFSRHMHILALSDSDCSAYSEAQMGAHIQECRLSKQQIAEVDEMIADKLRMDLTRTRWDLLLCVVVFLFHQAVMALPDVCRLLATLSAEFEARNGHSFADLSFHSRPACSFC